MICIFFQGNMYWGWGGEDDDLAIRIKSLHLPVHRPPEKLARYRMMKHQSQKLNKNRHKHLHTASKRRALDGVNSVQYKVLNITLYNTFTHIYIDIGL
jgi:hypothetical protein